MTHLASSISCMFEPFTFFKVKVQALKKVTLLDFYYLNEYLLYSSKLVIVYDF